jgi:hypothetical protein
MAPNPKETDNMINILFKLYDKWGTNFVFEIYYLKPKKEGCDGFFFHILYDSDAFCFEDDYINEDEDFIFTEEHFKKVFSKLLPRKILTYGSLNTDVILEFCEPEIIEFLSYPDTDKSEEREVLTLSTSLSNNYLTVKNRLSAKLGKTLRGKVCIGLSIKEIRCPKKKGGNYSEYLGDSEDYRIYPDITVMELPLNSKEDIYEYSEIFPNVTDFYVDMNPEIFKNTVYADIKRDIPKITLHLI